jgi:Spy/CpxP family protein refolding chaperone
MNLTEAIQSEAEHKTREELKELLSSDDPDILEAWAAPAQSGTGQAGGNAGFGA